jgi:hypothetical protein
MRTSKPSPRTYEGLPRSAPKERRGWKQSRSLKWLLAASGITLGAANMGLSFNHGKLEHYPAHGMLEDPNYRSQTIVTANLAGISDLDKQLTYVGKEIKPAAICLEEVKQSDVGRYMSDLEGYSGEYAEADSSVDFPDGFGNLVLVRYPQTKPASMQQLDGDFGWQNFTTHIFSRSLGQNIRDSYSENRAAVAVHFNMPMKDGAQLPVDLIASHIAADSNSGVGRRQIISLKRFVDEESDSDQDSLAVVCGDLNRIPNQARKIFSFPTWEVPLIGPTSVNSGEQIDQIILKPEIKGGNRDIARYVIAKTGLVHGLITDHRGAYATFTEVPLK